MKLVYAGIGALGLALVAMPAQANDEFLETCAAYAAENDTDVNCECLNEAAEENPELYEEYAKVSKPEDAALMSEEAQEVAAQCAAE